MPSAEEPSAKAPSAKGSAFGSSTFGGGITAEDVLGRCAGEKGDILFDSESVHLSKEEDATFGAPFKNRKSSKNGYKTRDYVDRKRRNVAVAILQILQPHKTTYMLSWQVEFVELALAGTPIHWACILWKATHPDEVPAITPPARLRGEKEPMGAQATCKRKFDGEAELSRRELLAVLVRRQTINEQARPKQKARKLILPTGSSADTGRAAIARDSPSSKEDVNTEVLGRSTDLLAPKARVRSEEALRPSGHRGEEGPSAQEQFKVVPSAKAPLAMEPPKSIPTGEVRDEETRVPSAEAHSAGPDWKGVVGPPGAGSPTPLEVLVGHGVKSAAEYAARPSARESPRISLATEILKREEDTPSEEEELQSMRGTPTGVLCEQVVPLLRYLDRKATKYGDPRQCGSYVELVLNRTQMKVATNPALMVLDVTIFS
ncbi:hypothetical protein AXG93_1603s1000 [Marchantia polymorpha subsp. ruderalis]|uniref:Uncharacterized protein n=1 Tax=Marchantia polymorpha subsp. ruderalis TaxID=1480154 RepID=A0A176VUW7_MARPO|nr:hypothetical protein AXG93_1603s1000 [Marchantia polymorpha subsp. ruderalis]